MTADQLFIIAILTQVVTAFVAVLTWRTATAARNLSASNNKALNDPYSGLPATVEALRGKNVDLVFVASLAAQRKGELEGRDWQASKQSTGEAITDAAMTIASAVTDARGDAGKTHTHETTA